MGGARHFGSAGSITVQWLGFCIVIMGNVRGKRYLPFRLRGDDAVRCAHTPQAVLKYNQAVHVASSEGIISVSVGNNRKRGRQLCIMVCVNSGQ
jgi:hypothetical protein